MVTGPSVISYWPAGSSQQKKLLHLFVSSGPKFCDTLPTDIDQVRSLNILKGFQTFFFFSLSCHVVYYLLLLTFLGFFLRV